MNSARGGVARLFLIVDAEVLGDCQAVGVLACGDTGVIVFVQARECADFGCRPLRELVVGFLAQGGARALSLSLSASTYTAAFHVSSHR
jgi:hypothetical protein